MYGTVKRKHFSCVDVHCGGEPARILISGYPSNIPGRYTPIGNESDKSVINFSLTKSSSSDREKNLNF